MAADRDPPTAADVAVTAASPALVMLMVGSLVFFLVEVLYAGKYSDRLLYTFFFFESTFFFSFCSQFSFCTHLTCYGCNLIGECCKSVNHLIDGIC